MSDKFTEYQEQLEKANKLKQAAIDERIAKVVSGIEDTFKAIEQLIEIAPDFKISKLSQFRKLAAKFGLSESDGDKKSDKGKGGKKNSGFKLSEEKAKEILDFIGTDVKSTQEIADKFESKNISPALTYLRKAGKIKVGKKEGLKKFWVKA